MEFLHKLFIQVTPGGAADLITAIDATLDFGWQRDRDKEKASEHTSMRGRVTCYRCDNHLDRPAAIVSLWERDDALLHGASHDTGDVVPIENDPPKELTTAQLNRVLLDFHDNVLSRLPPESCLGFVIGKLPEASGFSGRESA